MKNEKWKMQNEKLSPRGTVAHFPIKAQEGTD